MVNKENLLLSKAQIALVGASQWILKTFDNTEYADLEELSMRISSLYTIADNNLLTLDFNEREKSVIEKEKNKIKWINHYLSKIKDPLKDMIMKYEWILDGKIETPKMKGPLTLEELRKYAQNVYITAPYDSIFSYCYQCPERLNCFCLFKTFLVCTFSGKINLLEESLMRDIFKDYREKFGRWLKSKYLRKDDRGFVGYPYLIDDPFTPEDYRLSPYQSEIDSYVTASLLYLLQNEDLLKWFGIAKGDDAYFKKDSGENSPYTRVINTIKELQLNEEIHKKKNKKYLFDSKLFDTIGKYPIFGSWYEGFWGGNRVNRVKSTSSIARMLYEIDKDSEIIKGIVENAKIFVKGAFGDKNYALDDASFRDINISILSNISGTISGLLFLLTIKDDFDIPDDYIEPKIEWLINQQRPDGAFPVLSDRFIKEYDIHPIKTETEMEEYIIKKAIKENEKERERHNISLNNTIEAIELLILYLKKYGGLNNLLKNLSLADKIKMVLSHEKEVTACSIDMFRSTDIKKGKSVLDVQPTFDAYRNYLDKILTNNNGNKWPWVGDGIFCIFEDPNKAINASFQIQEGLSDFNKSKTKRLKELIRVRIGVNTGLAFIDESQEKGRWTSETFDEAGHLQENCPPGKILILKNTYDKLSDENKAKFKKQKGKINIYQSQ